MVRLHPDFFKDLDRLSTAELEVFSKKREKIKESPLRLKHLSGDAHCYREPITKGVRLVYFIEGDVIWFLTIGRHDDAYAEYRERLRTLRERLK